MTEEMKSKIDAILESVREPETLRSVSSLNLVRKVSCSDAQKRIIVETDITAPKTACFVCGVVTETIRESIIRELQEEFEKAFPGYETEVI